MTLCILSRSYFVCLFYCQTNTSGMNFCANLRSRANWDLPGCYYWTQVLVTGLPEIVGAQILGLSGGRISCPEGL